MAEHIPVYVQAPIPFDAMLVIFTIQLGPGVFRQVCAPIRRRGIYVELSINPLHYLIRLGSIADN